MDGIFHRAGSVKGGSRTEDHLLASGFHYTYNARVRITRSCGAITHASPFACPTVKRDELRGLTVRRERLLTIVNRADFCKHQNRRDAIHASHTWRHSYKTVK